ncbi:MAG: SAM-dependent methyltransferase [Bacteroidetes bacterium]|nr:MAG: SAM-dependent methyltransferase [Bacteroidota bacterium]
MEITHFLYHFARHFFLAKNAHGLHSPFVFDLYQELFAVKKEYYAFKEIQDLRFNFLQDHELIEIQDFGTGKSEKRKVSDLAKKSAISRKKGEFLFKLVNYFQPKIILELGTSLGIGTAYLEKARPESKIFSFEGSESLLNQAKKHLQKSSLVQGNLDNSLKFMTDKMSHVDFVFFDANHRFEPTIRYFEICLAKAHENTVFVFDDIHWSAEMSLAWKKVCAHPYVTLSLDFLEIGLVFFRMKQPKQHFLLKF